MCVGSPCRRRRVDRCVCGTWTDPRHTHRWCRRPSATAPRAASRHTESPSHPQTRHTHGATRASFEPNEVFFERPNIRTKGQQAGNTSHNPTFVFYPAVNDQKGLKHSSALRQRAAKSRRFWSEPRWKSSTSAAQSFKEQRGSSLR